MKDKKFTILQLTSGLLGMLCPIPVVGEAFASGLLYPIFNEGITKDEPAASAVASMATAGLMRMKLYEPIYFPMIEYAQSYFS